ncbi:hypothetical protein [Methanobacterium ferruginis]|uniref:hypothetical protein n=1 Tax=Methanobacterium ferruginis TaxID=710191 RepID=UPI00257410E7|nr:hypothetical protein [Methanobacterium ferruginis]BDZ68602.1 hypothetical protein GCM10025860_20500 [Methanobacterium ferruginis]
MSSICFETGWSEEYAYERDMNVIHDMLYRDLEYFPEGPEDIKEDFEAKRGMLRR